MSYECMLLVCLLEIAHCRQQLGALQLGHWHCAMQVQPQSSKLALAAQHPDSALATYLAVKKAHHWLRGYERLHVLVSQEHEHLSVRPD